MMNRAQFKKELQQGLNTVFGLEYKRYPEEWRHVFEIAQSRKAYEEDVLVSGLGAAPIKAEGASVAYDEGREVYTARYYNQTIALAFALTEEALEDNLYGDLGARYAKALARSLQQTKEVLGANVLNNGFSSSAPGGDAVALFSASHPLAGGGTLSNTLATSAQLAEASLEQALIQISGLTDDRGIPLALQVECLVVPKEQSMVSARLLKSPYRTATSDNDINVIHAEGLVPDFYVNHRLTSTGNWYLKTDCPDGMKHFVRKGVQRGVEGDFETGNLRYKSRERYSFGWSDWRGMFGVMGS